MTLRIRPTVPSFFSFLLQPILSPSILDHLINNDRKLPPEYNLPHTYVEMQVRGQARPRGEALPFLARSVMAGERLGMGCPCFCFIRAPAVGREQLRVRPGASSQSHARPSPSSLSVFL